ncbi:hypothetical protein AKJ16_DCAP00966 [Drosera capensis]
MSCCDSLFTPFCFIALNSIPSNCNRKVIFLPQKRFNVELNFFNFPPIY